MINKLIIYNQNIRNLKEDLEINFQDRTITVSFCKNSILKLSPHLYTAVINQAIHFDEEKIEGESTLKIKDIEIDVFKKSLGVFLKQYFQEKKQNIKCKMDLIKMYVSFNDMKNTLKVLKQMNRSANVKMIEFILKKESVYKSIQSGESSISNNERHESSLETGENNETFLKANNINERHESSLETGENNETFLKANNINERYESFIEICKDLDFHTRYLFAIEIIPILPSNILFRLHTDIKQMNCDKKKKNDSFKIDLTHSTEESLKYELYIFLRFKIADEFTRRRQYRMTAVTLISLSMEIYDPENMELRLELLKTGYSLLDKYCEISEHNRNIDMLDHSDIMKSLNPQLMLNPTHLFYIKPNKNTSIKIEVSSLSEIFSFDVVKRRLMNVFTDQFIVKTSTMDGIMGIIGNDGVFYPANNGKIRSDSTVECNKVILKDGRQIESYFKMEKIIRDGSVELMEIKKEDGNIKLEFKYSGKLPPNCYFVDANEQRVEQDRMIVIFRENMKLIEYNVEIKPGIYEVLHIRLI